jgi:cation diffusion facilitator family transporter
VSTTSTDEHRHSHSFGLEKKNRGERKARIVIALTAVMMVLEVTAGIAFGSMALLADGIHMASHAVALGIAAFAYAYARRHAHDRRFSFGAGKVNALGGYSGSILLGVFAALMAWESVNRLLDPVEIAFNQALIVAVLGLVVNGVSVFVLHDHHHDHDHDHNRRAAYFHVLADALTSLTAIAALLIGKIFGIVWVDPLMGIAGSVVVARWAYGLMKETSQVLLDHQNSGLAERITESLEDLESTEVSDLHVWSIGPGSYAAIVSVVTPSPRAVDDIKLRVARNPEIVHVTVEQHVSSR